MKIKETKLKHKEGRSGGTVKMVRVREIPDDQKLPTGAEKVDDKTPVHDWKEGE